MQRFTKPGFDFTSDFVASSLQSFPIAEALKQLQRYEDTELEPEQLKEIADIFNCDSEDVAELKRTLLALKDAEQKRREGCEFCKIELKHFPYVVAHSDYSSSRTIYTPHFCPMCGRDMRGEGHEHC